jgi:hypothetical protein
MPECGYCGCIHSGQGRYCSTDCRNAARDTARSITWYDCPDCGQPDAASPDQPCPDCRRDGPDPVRQMGGDQQ